MLVVPPVVSVPKSDRVVKEKQRPLFTDLPDSPLPPLSLLEDAPPAQESVSAETLEYTSRLIERKLADFGVSAKVLAAYPGPVITRFEIEPAVGVKGAQIVNLIKDLARALSVVSIRVVETIPGKSCMGLELPNPRRQVVKLVEILASTTYNDTAGALTLALGKDIAGKPVVVDLAKMPHLLVAGTTGSGKSVAVNAMILSLLYKAEPRQVRLILIDPKMLELSMYEGIPHLLAPVVTDMKLAPTALNWCVGEMERRYKLMSQLSVRNLAGYNAKVAEGRKSGRTLTNPLSLTPDAPEPLEEMPQIVVVVDELADLMMVTGKKIEELIARIAQKARAAGIHLILATQRPSVDVITGLIKANIPSRIAFQVASKIDSRTILDQMGAEALLGQGDMLYLAPGTGYPVRVHGAFVSDGEVHRVVEHLKLARRAAVHRRPARWRRRRRGRGRRCRRRRRCRVRSGLRPGGRRRAQDPAAVDFAGAAAPAHRLQPGGAADRADGARGPGVADADQRQSRGAGALAQGRRLGFGEAGSCCRAGRGPDGHRHRERGTGRSLPARSEVLPARPAAHFRTHHRGAGGGADQGDAAGRLLRPDGVRVRLHLRRRERVRHLAGLCSPVPGSRRTQGQGRSGPHLPDPGCRRQLPGAHPGHRIRSEQLNQPSRSRRAMLAALAVVMVAGLTLADGVAAATIERLRDFVRDTQTARASFTQTVADRNGRIKQQANGEFLLARPGKFRWSVDKPYKQLLVGDGKRVWIFDEDLNQVIVRKVGEALGATPAALLSGDQEVERAFAWRDLPAADGLDWLLATPLAKDAAFSEIRLGFDGGGLAALELLDAFGQKSVIRFTAMERNPKLSPELFRFVPPKGADVIGEVN